MNSEPDLLTPLRRYWGYDAFRPLQESIVRSLLAGRDACVVMPTGGGKSLCYQLPAAMSPDKTVIVISPLIALMEDQVAQLGQMGIPAALLNSSISPVQQSRVIEKARAGEYRLLYLSPERLAREDTNDWLKGVPVLFFAIDEAHCISEWGHEFRPEYRQLSRLRAHFPDRAIAAFTASATQRVRHDIIRQLELREPDKYIASFHRPNLRYVVRACDASSQTELLLRAMRSYGNENIIVYAPTIATVESTVDLLQENGIPAIGYHGQMNAADRQTQSGALDGGRSARDGRHDRVRPGHQQSRRARRDPSLAAEIHRAVLPGGGTRRARRPSRGLRSALAEERCGSARLLYRPDQRSGRKRARLAALSRNSRICGIGHLPPPSCLRPFWREQEMDLLRGLRCLRLRACLAVRASGGIPSQTEALQGAIRRARAYAGERLRGKGPRPRQQRVQEALEVDPDLREFMREWRRETANEQNVPAYVVMHDTTLDEICRVRPGSIAGLLHITGIGERKAELYGRQILDALKRFGGGARAAVPDKKISPSEETIQLIEEGKTLDEIAVIRGRRRSTIVSMVSDLVERGLLEFQEQLGRGR